VSIVQSRAETGEQPDATSPDGIERGAGIPAISLVGVSKTFRVRDEYISALAPTSLTIEVGEFFSLLGPSGCGKSTTLRILAGFEQPTSGHVLLGGRDVTDIRPARRDVNLVFQNYALFPHMSVARNVAYGLEQKKLEKKEIRRRTAEMLELVDLTGKEDRLPRELSGGQQQRVALARALVNHPSALLLDEPLAALDLKLRESMQVELKRIQRDVGITFVYVTHDQAEALAMSDRICVMNDGHIEQVGTPRQVYEHPATRFVAGFIGKSNLLSGRIDRITDSYAVLGAGPSDHIAAPHGGRFTAGQLVDVTIRPEKMYLQDSPGDQCRMQATVGDVVYQGTSTNYTVTTVSGTSFVIYAPNGGRNTQRFQHGDVVWATWSPEDAFVIGETPGRATPEAKPVAAASAA
jgi:spermidine/putrescine transport system ATP-binding protein